jgi:hypothetical protein
MSTWRPTAPLLFVAAGTAGVAVALALDARSLLAAYLASVVAISAIPIGSLAVLMISYLVRRAWTEDLHAPLISAASTMPVAALLFLPILVGVNLLYPWAHEPGAIGGFKGVYLAPWFFVARTVIYFALWTSLAVWAARVWGTLGMTAMAAAGLIIYALTGSLAAIDWIASLTPDFHSSIYGLLFLSYHMLTGVAFGIGAILISGPRPRRLDGYGGLLLASILLWAYLHAMQYIVVWSADIPAETIWYMRRAQGGWAVVLGLLAVLQLVLPFFAMLSGRVRARPRPLLAIAAATLALRVPEAWWLVLPGREVGLLFLAAPATLMLTGGLWWMSFRFVAQRLASNSPAHA